MGQSIACSFSSNLRLYSLHLKTFITQFFFEYFTISGTFLFFLMNLTPIIFPVHLKDFVKDYRCCLSLLSTFEHISKAQCSYQIFFVCKFLSKLGNLALKR